jgi:hypothetical protein
MDFANKVFIIIILILILVITSVIDLFHEYFFPTLRYDETEKERKIYNMFQKSKLILDIPFVILSIYLLLNIKFSPLIVSFIVLQYIGMFEDYILEKNKNILNLDKNIQYFLTHNFPIYLNTISIFLGLVLLYKILKTKE